MTDLLLYITDWLLGPSWHWAAYVVAALIQCGLLLAMALCSAAIYIWLERKVAARIQDRLGPTRVGGRFGWLQPPADGIKLLCKEDIIPEAADRPLFRIAPYVSFCAVFCSYLGAAVCRRLGRLAIRDRRVLHPGRDGAGSVRRDPRRIFLDVEMVALRGDARGRASDQLRNPAGPVRGRAGADRRHDGLGDDRQHSGGLVLELERAARSVHFRHVFRLLHLCGGEHESRPVRPARGRERIGGRLLDRILRLPLGGLFHGRIRGDFRGLRAGGDPVSWRMERPGAGGHVVPGSMAAGLRTENTRKLAAWIGNLLGMCNFIAKGDHRRDGA